MDEAVEGFSVAAKLWPLDPIFTLELFVIRKSFGQDLDPDVLTRLAPEVRADPSVALFLALDAGGKGDTQSALEFYLTMAGTDRQELFPFCRHYADLINQHVLPLMRESVFLALNRGDDATPELDAITRAIGEWLVVSDRAGRIKLAVRESAFFDAHRVPNPSTLTLAALEMVAERLSAQGNLARLDLLIALDRLDVANELARELLGMEALRGSCWLSRTVATFAARQRDAVLERIALIRFDPSTDSCNESIDPARRVELTLRRNFLGADRPLDVFIGFFGQMREPDFVLPQLVESVVSGFEKSECGPFNLTFGLSAWERTGNRPLRLDDSWQFYFQLLPGSIRHIVNERYGSDGKNLATVYPNLIAEMIKYTGNRKSEFPSLAGLASLLPTGTSLQIEPEATFEVRVREALSRGKSEEGWDHINQFKLWSRIAGLNVALNAQESRIGRSVDACVFMRCDLVELEGQIADLVCRVASPYDENLVFNDYDPHADYIEGSGDRYIVASRRAANVLFGGLNHYIAIYGGCGPRELKPRISYHEGLQSILFLNGLAAVPVKNFNISFMSLHRGSVPPSVILPALHADLARAKGAAKSLILEAIQMLSLDA